MSATTLPVTAASGESPTRRAIRRFLRHRLAVAGFIIVVVAIILDRMLRVRS